jgi:hypothetical protein
VREYESNKEQMFVTKGTSSSALIRHSAESQGMRKLYEVQRYKEAPFIYACDVHHLVWSRLSTKWREFFSTPRMPSGSCGMKRQARPSYPNILLLVLYAILSSVFSLTGFLFIVSWFPLWAGRSGLLPAVFPFLVIGTILSFIIGLFLGGAIVHLFVYLVGGRKGVEQTLKPRCTALHRSLSLAGFRSLASSHWSMHWFWRS